MHLKRSLLSLALGVALAITLALLSACGGGGDDGTDDQARITPPNCQERPELCR